MIKDIGIEYNEEIIQKNLLIISSIKELFDNFIKLNEFNNEKNRYKLKIVLNYNEYDNIYEYVFYVVTGKYDKDILFKYNFFVTCSNLMYKNIEDIINYYSNNELYLYTSRVSNIFGNLYKIVLNNLCEIEFLYQTDKDRIFFDNLYKTKKKLKNSNLENKRLILHN